MAKRNKSNLIPPNHNKYAVCTRTNCEFWKNGCKHTNPNIYHGLSGLCRSFKEKSEEIEA